MAATAIGVDTDHARHGEVVAGEAWGLGLGYYPGYYDPYAYDPYDYPYGYGYPYAPYGYGPNVVITAPLYRGYRGYWHR